MDVEALIQEIENVIGETPEGVPIFQVRRNEPEGDAIWIEKIIRCAAAIERMAPPKSVYQRMEARILDLHDPAKNSRQTAERLKAVLLALREDISELTMRRTEEIIHGDLLSGFLDMALRFVHDGFKDPGAVLTGSVLAEQLRRLCIKFEITIHRMHDGKRIPKNVTQMNEDLAAAGIYDTATERLLESWNVIRLNALHGRYTDFTQEEVRLMAGGLRDFMTRFPA